ncbi:MAG: tetratricopeptide repeat protein [Ostreibacterium sp.]
MLGLVAILVLLTGCITTLEGYQPPKPKTANVTAKSYFDLGVAYMKEKRFDLAEPKLQRALQLDPTPEAYNALAVLYEEMHDNVLAEETYKTLTSNFPDYARGYLNYNIFLCKYNRTGQIESLSVNMAAKNKKMVAIGQIAAGDCAYSKGDNTIARQHYNKALQYEQYAAGALLPLAEMDLKAGFVEQAKEKVDLVNNFIGYSARSVYLSLLINRELGNSLEERKMLQTLKKRFANTPEATAIFGNR